MKYLKVKGILDRLLAVMAIILLVPFFLLIAILIKIDSHGPVFFVQKRAGKGMIGFHIYKFRTMKTGSKAIKREDGTIIVTAKDPRVTRVGRFLRSGLDELPQLLNVAKGEMSIVGPRPDLPEQLRDFSIEELKKYSVLPGITNLPAVCGRNDLNFKDRIALDLYYIEQMSFKLDIQILWHTLLMPFGVTYKVTNRTK